MGLVEIGDDLRQHGSAFGRVGEGGGPGGQVCADAVLEVEGEVWLGQKVRVPAGGSVEEDLGRRGWC
jgi:hypothetical protein